MDRFNFIIKVDPLMLLMLFCFLLLSLCINKINALTQSLKMTEFGSSHAFLVFSFQWRSQAEQLGRDTKILVTIIQLFRN